MDQFIQLHTLLIKGINPNISPESAERGIGKVFSLRFGASNILKIQLFRPFENIKKLVKKRKVIKKKLQKALKQNDSSPDDMRVRILIGSKLFCSQQLVDAQFHYQREIETIDA